jgi:glycosyltransferase involved in cell wall biosynthesis
MAESIALNCDAVIMLTWSDWKTEPRSNRYHYAVRLARRVPVYFVQPDAPADGAMLEPTGIDNLTLVHAGPEYSHQQIARLNRLIADKDIRRPLLWVYNVNFEHFIAQRTDDFVVYHGTEDYFSDEGRLAASIGSRTLVPGLRRVLGRTDLLVTVSDGVMTSYLYKGGYTGPHLVLHNGCDFAFWDASGAARFIPQQNGRPVAFYQGGLNNRVDYALLSRLAARMPDWDFWLTGRSSGETAAKAVLEQPNVTYWGERSIDDLARQMQQASVGLIPFLDEPLMQISLPLKAYEYVACGLPVVSNPIDALEMQPDLFTIARTPEDFERAIRRLAPSRTDAKSIEVRITAAREQSYDARFDDLEVGVADAARRLVETVGRVNILLLYDDRSTHVKTIAEHLAAFQAYSRHNVYYLPCTGYFEGLEAAGLPEGWAFSDFDVLVVHYCVRVCMDDHLNPAMASAIATFDGRKVLFIQDEYDNTETARRWIERLRFDVVYTCVPDGSVERIYPRDRFPKTTFVQTLTGYVPEGAKLDSFRRPLAERSLRLAYRGRDLPYQYGNLAREKYAIGLEVKRLAAERGVPVDIEVDSASRIYGDDWYKFLASARATLGTESGSNIFDFDGTLAEISKRLAHLPYAEVHTRYLAQHEGLVRMNQISPKIFEAIRLGTALVLFEGDYSGVVKPDLHYIPLKKDYSNIDEVFARLEDIDFLEQLTERAHRDVIETGRYSYRAFVSSFDDDITSHLRRPARCEIVAVPLLRRPRGSRVLVRTALSNPLSPLLGSAFLSAELSREDVMATFVTPAPQDEVFKSRMSLMRVRALTPAVSSTVASIAKAVHPGSGQPPLLPNDTITYFPSEGYDASKNRNPIALRIKITTKRLLMPVWSRVPESLRHKLTRGILVHLRR